MNDGDGDDAHDHGDYARDCARPAKAFVHDRVRDGGDGGDGDDGDAMRLLGSLKTNVSELLVLAEPCC
jgi:hypothetical protein